MPFVPIAVEDFVRAHMKANPGEDRAGLECRLGDALAARQAGETCRCGAPIWVIGSAMTAKACFTCITGEAVPVDDYEIAEACRGDEA